MLRCLASTGTSAYSLLAAGGKSSAAARGGGAAAFTPIWVASPRASSARTPRGTAAIDRCDTASEIPAVQVENRCGTDQHEIDRGLADDGAQCTQAGSRPQQPVGL